MYPCTLKICVIGLGYIGLPTASILATKGFTVLGCDVNSNVVQTINRGEIHIVEPGLDILVRSAVQSGRFSAFTTPQIADIYIIAVPTPFKDDHQPDVSYVDAATTAIAPLLRPGALIILESTSPIGTTERVTKCLSTLRPELSTTSDESIDNRVYVAHCPERVLPGNILQELVENDRIIGGIDQASAEKAREFYKTFVQGEIFLTNARTAEMSKLAENSFRDVNIAFANELSIICQNLDINVWELIFLANHHRRVNILQPGPGVGGHCIAVDPWFIIDAAPDDSHLIRAAREVNDKKPFHIIERTMRAAARFKNPVIACFGLSFKANIDDLRESPALQIVLELSKRNVARLLVVEPFIEVLPASLEEWHPEVMLVDVETALLQADIVLLLVDHKQFYQIDVASLSEKVVIDTKGLWEPVSKISY